MLTDSHQMSIPPSPQRTKAKLDHSIVPFRRSDFIRVHTLTEDLLVLAPRGL